MTHLKNEGPPVGDFPPHSEAVLLPDFPYKFGDLKAQGYRCVGIDIVIGSIDAHTGEPSFIFEICKETEKTFDGQLGHPKETMKRNSEWDAETFDEATRRCLSQELGVDIDSVPLLADPKQLTTEGDTYVIKEGEVFNYKAVTFVLWDPSNFSWLPADVDTREVKGVTPLSLSEILAGDPAQFRECTQDIFASLQANGYFALQEDRLKRLAFRKTVTSNRVNGFVNIDLHEFPLIDASGQQIVSSPL